MPQNVFQIYDGRVNFWQWDTGQKLIVLDDSITEVHFSNRDLNHSITKDVYEHEGKRLCNVPDIILQLPKNLIAYACTGNSTIKSVKFAVVKRPIPDGYIMDQGEKIDDIDRRLEELEKALEEIESGNRELHKFEFIEEAEQWAKDNKAAGSIVAIHINTRWIAYIVEDDYSISTICDNDGNAVEVNVFDGGDGNGYNKEEKEKVFIWDGGSASGV